MTSSSTEPITHCPPPWTLKATVYGFFIYITPSEAKNLPAFIYSPLEAESTSGKDVPIGGLAMVQVIRYTDSPVGPYDELLLVPGAFKFEKDEEGRDGKIVRQKKVGLRLTRIFVSQKHTCWNGRTNWNIPKHLARFQFTDLPNGVTEIVVYPTLPNSSASSTMFSPRPFFRATYKPIAYTPSMPMSTTLASYIGMDLNLYQPPLPSGNTAENIAARGDGKEGELPSTDEWCKVFPYQYSKKTSLGWWDLKQKMDKTEDSPLLNSDEGGGDGDGDGMAGEESTYSTEENWWPEIGRWRIGVKMEDTTIVFEKAETWSLTL